MIDYNIGIAVLKRQPIRPIHRQTTASLFPGNGVTPTEHSKVAIFVVREVVAFIFSIGRFVVRVALVDIRLEVSGVFKVARSYDPSVMITDLQILGSTGSSSADNFRRGEAAGSSILVVRSNKFKGL